MRSLEGAKAQEAHEIIGWCSSKQSAEYLLYQHGKFIRHCHPYTKQDGMGPAFLASGDLLCFVEGSILDIGFLRFWTSMFEFNPSMYAVGPGVFMISRKDFIGLTGFYKNLENNLMKVGRIRVECADYITPLNYLSMLGELGIESGS